MSIYLRLGFVDNLDIRDDCNKFHTMALIAKVIKTPKATTTRSWPYEALNRLTMPARRTMNKAKAK
jgi:hypothetical protein